MPGDTDVLAVLAEQCATDNPIDLLQRLEEAGLEVSVREQFDPAAQRAAVQEFSQTLDPIWEQGTGTRNRLLGEGWSEEMAEHLASHAVHLLLDIIAREIFGAPAEAEQQEEDHG